ncbi:hypothetical protein MLIT_31210 [Mycolicibacterium litorale]|uniref:Uncharacterized protein n=1 Tax=Mycolicibacterium litorale TaxID=758802 RepID=A0AAD1IL90_9MYCO|nr:putative membrane protein [Mycolicibacterium litorale]BBY17529.1 hypothetical protein MLIT_31210 [Mycolicibacterium litorale]
MLLAVVVTAFLLYSVPPYASGGSRVPPTFAWHYPLLVAHVLLASVAMVAVVAQLWSRRFHRSIGRTYVVTAVPAAASALVIGALTPFGPMLAVSNVVLAVLWLWFTLNGFRHARRGRWRAHRADMVRSAALALSVITNRIWTPVLVLALDPLRENIFGGDEQAYLYLTAGLGGWLGWLIPLAAAQWWLRRRRVTTPSPKPFEQGTRPV